MDDLYKVKCKHLHTLAKMLDLPGSHSSRLTKEQLVSLINSAMMDYLKQQESLKHLNLQPQSHQDMIGGDMDNCSYPCPTSPDGRHKFYIRGSVSVYAGEVLLYECEHCYCVKRE